MAGPLSDLLVVDLSHALAGPLCSTLLADFGARVIKVEPPGKGDIARKWGPPFYGDDSAYFVDLNRNKKSVEIDLKHPRGKELLLKLLGKADVLLENFRVGAMERIGLDYQRLSKLFEKLVYCSISGFGQTGPYRDRAAMDIVVQAESGMISVTGERDGRGARCGVSIADMGAGMNAAFAILAAIHARQKSGRGQYLDVSMLEGQLGLLDTMIAMYRADGVVPRPMGTAYKALLPYQTFRTATQDLAIAIGSEALWKTLCSLPGFEPLKDDPRYRTNADRSRNRDTLIPALQEIFLTRAYSEWETILLDKGIPVGAINTLDRAAEHPQAKARGAFVECDHPVAGKVSVVAPWVKLSETPGGVHSAAPLLGQHTDQVLRDQLGLSAAEIADLRRDGAIGQGL
jgi:crotonobetainyl-CoA:carnitine CoA-transferase CaiB-like acyl-CoA transferase